MIKINELQHPFSEKWTHGYIGERPDGRKIVYLYNNKTDKHSTTAYARYVMACHLKRFLKRNEHVDHVDEDPTNDSLANLQILTPSQNSKKQNATRSVKMVTIKCPYCGVSFNREYRQTHFCKGGKRTFCSRSCSAKFYNNIAT